jgi:hypothetical protein
VSSSTSAFDPVPQIAAPVRELVAGLLLAGIVVAAAILAVATVDPFNSQLSAYRFSFDRVATFRPQNVALWAALDIGRDPIENKEAAQIVMLGDSRGEQIRGGFNADRSFSVGKRSVYDLSFGGASLYEMLAFFDHYHQQFKVLKTVIIVLPLSVLVGRDETYDRSQEAFALSENPVLYLTNLSNLGKSIEWIRTMPPDPSYVAPWRFTLPPVDDVSVPACKANDTTATRTQTALAEETRLLGLAAKDGVKVIHDQIAPFVKRMNDAGIKVVIFNPPISPPVRAFIAENATTQVDELRSALAALTPNYELPSDFAESAGWGDAQHLCQGAAMQELQSLVAGMKL